MACAPWTRFVCLCPRTVREKQFALDRLSLDCGTKLGLRNCRHSLYLASSWSSLRCSARRRAEECAVWICGLFHVPDRQRRLYAKMDDEILRVVGLGQHGLV